MVSLGIPSLHVGPYVLSQSPILKIVVPVLTEPEMLLEAVDPAVTVTEEVATGYSPW